MHKAELWIQQSHKDCTLQNFDWTPFPKTRRTIESYCADKTLEHGLLLIGDPGVGKTHLIVGIFKSLLDNGLEVGSDVVYIQWADILVELRGIFSKEASPEEVVARICSSKYVLIDDIRPSSGVFWNTCLKLFIEQAYVQKTNLILTANLEDEQNLVSTWQLEDYYVSRLTTVLQILKVKGSDCRTLR